MFARVLKSLNAMLFGSVIARVGSLLMVPLFLSRWSPVGYGEWLTMFAAVSYLSTLDIGVQDAAVNRLTKEYARGDLENYRTCQHSALMLYVVVASAGTVLLLLASWLLPIPLWIGIRKTSSHTAAWVLVMLGIYVLWSMPAGVVISTYHTTGNLAKAQWLANMQQIASLILTATILVLGGGMVPLAALQVSLLGAMIVFVLWDLRQSLPDLFPGLSGVKVDLVKKLMRPSVLFAVLAMANLVVFQGSLLLVSAAIGGVTVALFSISRTLSVLMRQIVDVLGVSLSPDLAGMEARGEFHRMRRVHTLLVATSGGICAALAASLWFEGSSIISVWTRHRIQPDVVLLRLLVIYVLLESPWLASAALQAATNRHRRFATSYIIGAVVGLALAALLIRSLGVRAVPIGLIAGEMLACYHFVPLGTCQMIHEAYEPFARHTWFSFVLVSAAAMSAGFIAHYYIAGPIVVRWFGVGTSTFVASVTTTWVVWLKGDERSALLLRLQPLVTTFLRRATAT
jgi:O-antigen/teichoic acid export membrane protein